MAICSWIGGSRYFVTQFLCYFVLLISVNNARKCPSVCLKDPAECISKGGRVLGYCTNEDACCDLREKSVTSSCGAVLGNETSEFVFTSPKYPTFDSKDLSCIFSFQIRNDTVGILLDLDTFEMDGLKYGPMADSCDADMLFIRGFDSWTPNPICGNLRQFKYVIDDSKLENMEQLKLHALMSSSKYRWKIKISQISDKDWPDDEATYTSTENPSDADQTDEAEDNSTETTTQISTEEPSTEKIFTRDAYGEVPNSKENKDFDVFHHNAPILNVTSTTYDADSINSALVVNGENTASGKVPWQASLRINLVKIKDGLKKAGIMGSKMPPEPGCDIYEGAHFCGGTIISDQEILTAAHCFAESGKTPVRMPIKYVSVVLGDTNKCRDGSNTKKNSKISSSMFTHKFKNPAVKVFEIDSVVMHYAYERSVVMNDIAIVRLKEKIEFSEEIKKISLAHSGQSFSGKKAFVSGWGRTNLNNILNRGSNILQSSHHLKIGGKNKCKNHTLRQLKDTENNILENKKYQDIFKSTLCTSSSNKTNQVLVGQGDSGGPLVHFEEETSQPILIGVVSFMLTETENFLGSRSFVDFYQSVAFYRNWIDTTLLALRLEKK